MAIFLSTLFFSCSQEEVPKTQIISDEEISSRETTNCTGDLGVTSQFCLLGELETTLIHPDYPGCSFPVTVKYNVCFDHPELPDAIYVGDIEWGEHNCSEFSSDVLEVFLLGNPDLNDFIVDFLDKSYIALEPNLVSITGGIVQCGGETASTTITWVWSSCYALCLSKYWNKTGQEQVNFKKYSCASSGCCQRTTKLCRNDSGEIVRTTSTSATLYDDNCEGSSVDDTLLDSDGNPSMGNGKRCFYVSVCNFSCE